LSFSWIGRGPLIGGRGKEKDLLCSHWPRARNLVFGNGKLLKGVEKIEFFFSSSI